MVPNTSKHHLSNRGVRNLVTDSRSEFVLVLSGNLSDRFGNDMKLVYVDTMPTSKETNGLASTEKSRRGSLVKMRHRPSNSSSSAENSKTCLEMGMPCCGTWRDACVYCSEIDLLYNEGGDEKEGECA